jgi:hypothetical protein
VRRLALIPVLILAASAVASAAAQGGSEQITVGFPSGNLVAEWIVPVHVTGTVVVTFHGDQHAGCSKLGVCGYSGQVAWQPSGRGQLFIASFRTRRAGHVDANLAVGQSGPVQTVAHVLRNTAGHTAACGDVVNPQGTISLPVTRGKLRLALFRPGTSQLATRCAGPTDGDVAVAAPAATIALSAILKGGAQASLAGRRPFSAHGFAGTVTSTIRLAFGAARRLGGGSPRLPKGFRYKKMRTVEEQLIVHSAGQFTVDVRGSGFTGACQALDSCGASGTITIHPSTRGVTGDFYAAADARRPLADFMAALGRRRGGNPRRIAVYGSIDWTGGLVVERIRQQSSCVDRQPLGGSAMAMMPAHRVVTGTFGAFGTVRTSCPGPFVGRDGRLARASFRIADLAAGRASVVLRPLPSIQDDGYSASIHGHLTLSIRPGRITTSTFLEPVGP